MPGPITSLVLARLRRRGSTTALSIAAVAAAAALVAIVSGIGLAASDATLQRALATTGAERPVVRVSHYSSSGSDLASTTATVDAALPPLAGSTGPTVRGLLFHELLDLEAPVFELIVAVDDPAAWTTLIDGRLPAPCIDGARCEAVLLSAAAPDPDLDFTVARPAGDLAFTIVGRGQIDQAVPFGDLDQRGPFGDRPGGGEYQTGRRSPAIILVNGVDAMAASAPLRATDRTYIWTAPIDTTTVHPWTATDLAAAVEVTTRELTRHDNAFTVESPTGLIATELGRADAARGRLLLIGSLGVAILLAFAVFLALVMRDDVAAETARLNAVGARRRDRFGFLLLEALIPAVLGGLLGWLVGAAVVAVLAAIAGAEVVPVVGGALFAPGALLGGAAVLLVAALAIVATSAPGVARGGAIRVASAVGITVLVVLGWQLVAGGGLEAGSLADSLASPVVVLLPPALAFLVAMAFVAVLPPALRWLARRLRGAPLPVRLSLLSVSREPGRPAATLTLLAFSVGAIVFAMGWSASLRQGIDDGAAYRTGLDLRVAELGTGLSISPSVVPVARYATLGDDITAVPVYRDATETQPGGRVEIVGLPPAALATLPGWRSDFSPTPVAKLATDLDLPAPAAGWHLQGHRLAAGDRTLTLHFRYVGGDTRLDAVVSTDDGDSTVVPLGVVNERMTSVEAPLPDGARGGLITALIFGNDRIIAGDGHQGELRQATVTFEGLDGLVDATPIDIEVKTVATFIVRAPQVTDGVPLPAIVSPDLAADAGPGGILDLHVGAEGSIPLRVVGTANHVPTVVEAAPRFVIVPLDPWLVALAEAVPTAGRPSEVWISAPSPERLAAVRSALAEPPFRFAVVTSRADEVALRAGDPLSRAIVWALIVAAVAGLILSVGGLLLGAATDLRDERGELADLEAQGVPPSSLRWHALARTTWLAGGGAIAGLLVGIALTVVVTSALALTAEGTQPIPPLEIVLPLLPIALVVVGVVGVVLALVAWMARRAYGRQTLGERRGGESATGTSTAWRPGTERADG